MRIVIDLQSSQGGSRFRGIGRYGLALAKAISKNRGEHEIFIALNGLYVETIDFIRGEFEGILPNENIKTWNSPYPFSAVVQDSDKWKIDTAELLRETFIASLNPDIILISSFFEGYHDSIALSIKRFIKNIPVAVIFYDAIPLIQKENYLDNNYEYKKFYLDKIESLKKSDLFLAISGYSKFECEEHLGISPDKTVNISSAITSNFKKINISNNVLEKIKNKFNITRKILMYSGATDVRKNHLGLINAFSLLPLSIQQQYQLVFVGSIPPENKKKFEEYRDFCSLDEEDLIITSTVSDEELLYLYNVCDLFIFPSLHEGFGLPALEAMSCGAPIIASNTSSLPEVVGRKDVLFDPADVTSIANKIEEVLNNKELMIELRKYGLEQAKKFSWDISAQKTLLALEKLHKSNSYVTPEYNNTVLKKITIENLPKIKIDHKNKKNLMEIAQSLAYNFPKINQKKQILLDISQLVKIDHKTGIQRVVRSIAQQLWESRSSEYEINLVYTSNEINGYKYAYEFMNDFYGLENNKKDDYIELSDGDIFVGLDLFCDVINQKEFFRKLKSIGVKTYFVVYDLLPIKMPDYFPEGLQLVFFQWLQELSLVDGLIGISQAVMNEIEEFLPWLNNSRQKPLELGWFHLGADLSNSKPSLGLPNNHQETLDKLKAYPTFLMVGTIEPRKGHAQVIKAFNELWKKNININLVIVGKNGWNVDLLVDILKTHPERNNRLFWFDKVSDEYLDLLYQYSNCLIAASYGEGFGLPLIEAAQKKLFVIARDIPVFREVAGDFATYFEDTNDSSVITSTIENWLVLYKQNKLISSEKMKRITWQDSALQLFDNVANNQYSKLWLPNEKQQNFVASDPRFGSQVGIRKGLSLLSNKKKGYLLFGPYISLSSGQYLIKIQSKSSLKKDAVVVVDVVTDSGANILYKKEFSDTSLMPDILNIEFTLFEPQVDDFEIRVWINESAKVEIQFIELLSI